MHFAGEFPIIHHLIFFLGAASRDVLRFLACLTTLAGAFCAQASEGEVGEGWEGESTINTDDLQWRIEKARLEEQHVKRLLKARPRFLPYDEVSFRSCLLLSILSRHRSDGWLAHYATDFFAIRHWLFKVHPL